MKRVCSLLLAATAAFAQYKLQPSGDPPSEAAAPILATLNKAGSKIVADSGSTLVELWLRSTMPSGPASSEPSVTLPTIPQGALLGVLRFPAKGSDRRGQTIAPGVYTLRYGDYPINGNHQGVAPQRDFLILVPAALDKSADPISDFDALMDLSRKAAASAHPAVLSFWKADSDQKPGFEKQGEKDWVLSAKLGDTLVSIILIGKSEE
ncbi:MAG TPA: hypothetical protein VMT15_21605 [Bryobacteraceae bacterium]|nr:hypothetical protein [Bryobacteraceae bacterium]